MELRFYIYNTETGLFYRRGGGWGNLDEALEFDSERGAVAKACEHSPLPLEVCALPAGFGVPMGESGRIRKP
jgi:hypothetical protein